MSTNEKGDFWNRVGVCFIKSLDYEDVTIVERRSQNFGGNTDVRGYDVLGTHLTKRNAWLQATASGAYNYKKKELLEENTLSLCHNKMFFLRYRRTKNQNGIIIWCMVRDYVSFTEEQIIWEEWRRLGLEEIFEWLEEARNVSMKQLCEYLHFDYAKYKKLKKLLGK